MSQTTPVDPVQNLTSDEVRVTIHRKSGCLIELEVFASPILAQKAKKSAIKVVGKDYTIPGFRKGKAPEDLILKKFPEDVEKTFHKELADLAYTASQKLTRIPLLNNNARISFEVKSQSEKGVDLLFAFETEPKIPSIDPKAFTPKPVDRPVVSDIQVNEAIRQMQFFYAQWKNIEGRTIQDGDYILISVDTFEGDEPQRVFDHIRFEVSQERMANWMRNLVKGAKAGDVLDAMSEPDEGATEEEKKIFQPKKVRVTLHKAEEAELPELNDEFAKKLGSTDVAAMRAFVEKLLNEKADDKVKDELRNQVNDFLIANYSFDLPESLVETEKRDRIEQLQQDPPSKRKWDTMSNDERQKAEDEIKQEAAQAISLFYLSRHMVNEAKIPISQNDVQQEAIATLNAMRGRGQGKVDKIPKEVYALALSKVLLAKAQDHIIQAQKA